MERVREGGGTSESKTKIESKRDSKTNKERVRESERNKQERNKENEKRK